LIFSAAASTKDAIESLTNDFTGFAHVKVHVNAGPSNALADQILSGAPADLFLSANQQWADEVAKGGQTAEAVRLLTNRLVIVVPEANPAQVRKPSDLLSDRVTKIALAAEHVPAGMYADQALANLGLMKELVERGKIARGHDVRSALSYVERGEAEAGIVYSSDVGMATGFKSAHEFVPTLHDEIVYVLVLTKLGGTKQAARQLFEFLQSPAADATYAEFGFRRLH
jgi:molybdate transport system substrate-binding protein